MTALAFDSFAAPRSAVVASVRPEPALFVVEFRDTDGVWRPCCGDAYLDAEEAERCSERSILVTRVRRYVPGQEGT